MFPRQSESRRTNTTWEQGQRQQARILRSFIIQFELVNLDTEAGDLGCRSREEDLFIDTAHQNRSIVLTLEQRRSSDRLPAAGRWGHWIPQGYREKPPSPWTDTSGSTRRIHEENKHKQCLTSAREKDLSDAQITANTKCTVGIDQLSAHLRAKPSTLAGNVSTDETMLSSAALWGRERSTSTRWRWKQAASSATPPQFSSTLTGSRTAGTDSHRGSCS